MEQVSVMGTTTVLIHFFAYEKYIVREDQTIMRDSWREVPGYVVCMPNMTEFHLTPHHPNVLRTNDVRAVNCQTCKQTPVFNRMKERLETALRGPIRAT